MAALKIALELWIETCVLFVAAGVASRLAYYAFGLDLELVQRFIALQTLLSLPTMIADVGLFLPLAVMTAALWLWRRPLVAERVDDAWRLRAWVLALAWGVLALNQGFLEINRFLAPVCLGSLALVWLPGRRRALLALACVPFAPDLLDGAAAVLWVAVLAGVLALPVRRHERALALLLLAPLAQLVPALAPALVALHGGARVGDGMAYGFCEARGRVWGTVPMCPTVWSFMPRCLEGTIEEIDPASGAVLARHRPMSERFHGRLEEPVCTESALHIGMNRTLFEGRRQLEDAVEVSLDDLSRVRPHVLGEEGGHRVVHDRRRDALLYLGDDVPLVHRRFLPGTELERFAGTGAATQRIVYGDLHEARDRLYAVAIDAPLREIELEGLQVTARMRHAGGTELVVDEPRDRLLVTAFWGLEAIDLATRGRSARARTGMIARKPVVDAARGIVYVATMGEGKLHAFDRDTLAHLGQLPLGMGGRYPYLTDDGRWLFAGNSWEHFRWDAAELARRFKP